MYTKADKRRLLEEHMPTYPQKTTKTFLARELNISKSTLEIWLSLLTYELPLAENGDTVCFIAFEKTGA